jgi:hypothetical protein
MKYLPIIAMIFAMPTAMADTILPPAGSLKPAVETPAPTTAVKPEKKEATKPKAESQPAVTKSTIKPTESKPEVVKDGTIQSTSFVDKMAIMDAQISYLQKKHQLQQTQIQAMGTQTLPTVTSIYGDAKNGMTAKVRFENGLEMEVNAGDRIGNALIKKITSTQVIVGKNTVLTYTVPTIPNAGTSAPMPYNLPGLPQVPGLSGTAFTPGAH